MKKDLLTLRHIDESGTVVRAFSKEVSGKVNILD
jgi:hypothetical protein